MNWQLLSTNAEFLKRLVGGEWNEKGPRDSWNGLALKICRFAEPSGSSTWQWHAMTQWHGKWKIVGFNRSIISFIFALSSTAYHDQHLWEGLTDHRVVLLKLAWIRSLFQFRVFSGESMGIRDSQVFILCRVESPSSQAASHYDHQWHPWFRCQGFFRCNCQPLWPWGALGSVGGAYNLHIAPSSSRKSWQNTFLILAGLKMICRQFCRTVRR